MDKQTIVGGDNVIITQSTWESVIGKSGVVCTSNDSTDPNKLKVDFENGFVGYFTEEQLALDNDLTMLPNIIHHLKYMITQGQTEISTQQLERMLICLNNKVLHVERLTGKIVDLENQLSIFKTND